MKLDSRRIKKLGVLLSIQALITIALIMVAVLFGWSQFAGNLPELEPWHTDRPSAEFTARMEDPDFGIDDYLALEETLFKQLADLENRSWKESTQGPFNRFNPDSICHPSHHGDRNWNRSLLREVENPKGGVLMIHGLSDSPYSFRSFAERFHAEGYSILILRVPGHGTCPGALANAKWKDWTAAVRIAARDMKSRLPEGSPFIVAGFSNGGALTTHYAARAVLEGNGPVPDALILASPMISISSMAQITRFHNLIAVASGNKRAHWSGIHAPIDPYKYSSWPMNASVQAHRMTGEVESALSKLQKEGRMDEFPPVFAAVSVTDATVKISDLVSRLYDRIEGEGSELLIFDINRGVWAENLLKLDYNESVKHAIKQSPGNYAITLVSNRENQTSQVHEKRQNGSEISERALDLEWPTNIYSLSHSSIPFPYDDPLYGANAERDLPLPLGAMNFRGESGVLLISDGQILRLRHNPFHSYLEERLVDWLGVLDK